MLYRNATAEPRDELTDVIQESVTNSKMFIGLQLLPATPMSLVFGHVPKITIGQGDLMRAVSTIKRQPGTRFPRHQSAIGAHSVALSQDGEELQIPDEQSMTYEDYFAMEELYAIDAKNRLQRGHELYVASTIMNSANFDAVAAAVAYTAANLSTMQVIEDIQAAISRVKGRGEVANTIAMSHLVYQRVRVCPDVRAFVAGANQPGAIVNPQTLARAFQEEGIDQVLIGDTYVNQSYQLNEDVINAIWPNTYIFVGSCQTGALRAGGVGRTFYWEREGPLFVIKTYRDEPVKSNVIRSEMTQLTDLTNTRAGTLITTNYA